MEKNEKNTFFDYMRESSLVFVCFFFAQLNDRRPGRDSRQAIATSLKKLEHVTFQRG